MFSGGPLSYPAFAIVLICMLSLPADVRAAFEIVSHDVLVDVTQQQTTFTLTFNQPPDFFNTNDLGQANNAFQYFYDADPAEDEVDFTGEQVVIIRGAEIRIDNTIPIRHSLNPTGEDFPNAEGWGESLGEVDYELDGQTLSFTVGWNLLRESDDRFGYHLFALEHGELTSEFTFIRPRILIPLPPPLLAGPGILLLAARTARTRGRS